MNLQHKLLIPATLAALNPGLAASHETSLDLSRGGDFRHLDPIRYDVTNPAPETSYFGVSNLLDGQETRNEIKLGELQIDMRVDPEKPVGHSNLKFVGFQTEIKGGARSSVEADAMRVHVATSIPDSSNSGYLYGINLEANGEDSTLATRVKKTST